MAIMMHNWKVEFQNASGEKVFLAGDHASEMTTDIKTPETFLFYGLVKMEEDKIKMSDSGRPVSPLIDQWDKAVIDAQVFGVNDVTIDRADVSQATIDSAKQAAEHNSQQPPQPKLM